MNKVNQMLKKEPHDFFHSCLKFITVAAILLICLNQLDLARENTRWQEVITKMLMGLFEMGEQKDFIFNLKDSGLLIPLLQTVAIAFMGTVLGALISIPLAFLSTPGYAPKIIRVPINILTTIIKTIPLIVYALVFVVVVGTNAFCGTLVIFITSIGMLTRLFSQAIQEVPKNLIESADALGMNLFQKCCYVITPELFSNFISTTIYRFDINIKNSTLIGIVGAGGIGTALNFAIGNLNWPRFWVIIIVLVIMMLAIDYLSTQIRKRLV